MKIIEKQSSITGNYWNSLKRSLTTKSLTLYDFFSKSLIMIKHKINLKFCYHIHDILNNLVL